MPIRWRVRPGSPYSTAATSAKSKLASSVDGCGPGRQSAVICCAAKSESIRVAAVRSATSRCNAVMARRNDRTRSFAPLRMSLLLSAPPNPAVFTSHVVLVFRSTGYTQEAPSGQFQPAPAPVVRRQRETVAADSASGDFAAGVIAEEGVPRGCRRRAAHVRPTMGPYLEPLSTTEFLTIS